MLLTATAVSSAPLVAHAAQTAPAGTTDEAVEAANIIEDVGAVERMNLSGKMRMLTQRISAASCYAHAGIAKEDSSAMLKAASAELDQIIAGLEKGDESLGIIGEETDRKILRGLEKLNSVWDPLRVDITDILTNGGTDEEVVHLAEELDASLEVAKKLVNVVVNEYADPTAVLQSDALTIDIAGRQRMLAQRISKDICILATGMPYEVAGKQLKAAVKTYESSLNALRTGLPAAGVEAPPSDEIATGLDELLEIWGGVMPTIQTVMDGGSIDEAQQASMFHTMNKLTGKMNVLVGKYTEASKLGL